VFFCMYNKHINTEKESNMTPQEQMAEKGIAVGDECWVNYQGVGCLGIVHGFTAKRVLVENLCRNVDGAQPYAPSNVTKK
jgi:hypothetical protein